MNKTVAVSFTTDEEAGVVYSTIRKLKHEGLFSAYSMYDDYALIFTDAGETEGVINAFNDIAAEKKLPGIFAQED